MCHFPLASRPLLHLLRCLLALSSPRLPPSISTVGVELLGSDYQENTPWGLAVVPEESGGETSSAGPGSDTEPESGYETDFEERRDAAGGEHDNGSSPEGGNLYGRVRQGDGMLSFKGATRAGRQSTPSAPRGPSDRPRAGIAEANPWLAAPPLSPLPTPTPDPHPPSGEFSVREPGGQHSETSGPGLVGWVGAGGEGGDRFVTSVPRDTDQNGTFHGEGGSGLGGYFPERGAGATSAPMHRGTPATMELPTGRVGVGGGPRPGWGRGRESRVS